MDSSPRAPIPETGALPLGEPPGDPCVMVIFGASGDLTKRLLMPALYNLACDGLLPARFAIVGTAMEPLSTEAFRLRMTQDIKAFTTRKTYDAAVWERFAQQLHYMPGRFDDPAMFERLSATVGDLDRQHQAGGNVLFYLAIPPSLFGKVSQQLDRAGLTRHATGWRRVIVEKPFGADLTSARALNRDLLAVWSEGQIFRIDHYLGKETVQNILAFRFSNGIFEPLWNRNHIDHIQFTVSETVGVEGRGRYYETSGVIRDMVQNHMFQMLAYLCMEPPTSFRPDAVRNEKAKLLEAVRPIGPADVGPCAVRGQYGPGRKPDGSAAVGYRQEPDVDLRSRTETFAALKLHVDSWRWEGVPIYLRSGKSLWKRDTEILVQFKKAPEVIFRGTPAAESLDANQLIFHVQPDQGIELRFQAKIPGPSILLQKVNMRFDYSEAFEASRATGYEVLLYNCMVGDATLFSRTDLVEASWRIVQPIIETWAATDPADFPNYQAGSWGPKAAYELIERDGRKWLETINREILERVPLFASCDPVFLHGLALMLKPVVRSPGDFIIRKGDHGHEMYFMCRGEVDVLDGDGQVLSTLREGEFFGETSLLLSETRTASIRARTPCDLFVLDKADFRKVLREHPEFARSILQISRDRYQLSAETNQVFDPQLTRFVE